MDYKKANIFREMREMQEFSKMVITPAKIVSNSYVQSSKETVKAKIVGDDLWHWKGTIFGPVSFLQFRKTLLMKVEFSLWTSNSHQTTHLNHQL